MKEMSIEHAVIGFISIALMCFAMGYFKGYVRGERQANHRSGVLTGKDSRRFHEEMNRPLTEEERQRRLESKERGLKLVEHFKKQLNER